MIPIRRAGSQSLSVNQLLRYKYFRSILLYSVALVIALVIAAGVLFGSLYNIYSQDQMSRYAQDMMAQRVHSAELLWEEMESLAVSIYSDPDTSRFLQTREEDKILKYNAGRSLTKYKSLYSFLQNISLVNVSAGLTVSTLNYGEDLSFFTSHASLGEILWVPRMIAGPSFRYQDLSVLSLVYPVTYARQGGITGGIIIDIDQRHLQSLLQFTDVVPGASTVILDGDGVVASATSEQLFLSSYAEKGYASRILDTAERQGSFPWKEDGVQQLITWERLPGRDWIVVCTLPASDLQARFNGIIRSILIGLLVMLLAAVTAAILASRSVYQPIQSLVSAARVPDPGEQTAVQNEIEAVARQIDLMQQDHAQMQKTMHLTMVQHLLFGLPVNIREHDTVLRDASFYCVATVRPMVLQASPEASDRLIVATGHILAENLQQVCPCETAAWSGAAVAILCLQDGAVPDAVLLALENTCDWCAENLHHQAIAAFSGVVRTPEEIHTAYTEAQLVSQQAFYNRQERVFTPVVLEKWKKDIQVSAEWWGQRFASLLLDDDLDALEKERKELELQLSSLPPYQARQSAAEVLNCLYRKLENSGLPLERAEREILLPAVQTAESWEEVRRILSAALEDGHKIAGSYGQGLHNRRMVHEVCTWVQSHYTDPAMSLQSAADYAGLSASYLGRVFKAIEQQSFTEYVTAVRLEEAARQLSETDKPIAAIACDVGLENPSYFASLFKKEYGVTPSSWRQTNAIRK